VGIAGAFGYYLQEYLFENVLYIDDPLGASALHMGAGIVGLIAPAFLAHPDHTPEAQVGIFYGGTAKQLGWQIGAMFIYFGWAFVTCSVLVFWPLSALGLLRVSEEHELAGMDAAHHGGPAYDFKADGGIESGTSVNTAKIMDVTKHEDYVVSGLDVDSEGEEMLTEEPTNEAEILRLHPQAVPPGAL
jgi:hypothetical protein